MDEENDCIEHPILARIRGAGEKLIKSISEKRRASADLFMIYLEAKNNPDTLAVIEKAYTDYLSIPGSTSTKHLASKILYMAASDERRRVSELKADFTAADAKGIDSAEKMYDWLVKKYQKPVEPKGEGANPFKLLFSYAEKLIAGKSARFPVDVADLPRTCEKDEYLMQVCWAESGKFQAKWLLVKPGGHYEWIENASAPRLTAVPQSAVEDLLDIAADRS